MSLTSSKKIAPSTVNGQQKPTTTTTTTAAVVNLEEANEENENQIIIGEETTPDKQMFPDESKKLNNQLSSETGKTPKKNDQLDAIDNCNELSSGGGGGGGAAAGNTHCSKDIADSGGGGGGGPSGSKSTSNVSLPDKVDDDLRLNDSDNSAISKESKKINLKNIKNRKKDDEVNKTDEEEDEDEEDDDEEEEEEEEEDEEEATKTKTADGAATSSTNRVPEEKRSKRHCIRATELDMDGRYCWVCFATEEDDALAEWVQPCKCSGTTKWVHQTCLQRWVDEKQRGNSFKRVNCPQCQQEYIIVFPTMGTAFNILENVDAILKRISPFLAAGVIVGSLYWTAVTYGAITVLQVVGYREGLQIMEGCDPLLLLIGLPAIPIGLIAGRFLRWEDMILRFIHTHPFNARKFRPLQLLWPDSNENLNASTNNINLNYENNEENDTQIISSDPISATRVFCGALMLPTISAIIGKMFFESIQNNLHRTIVGGLSFVMVKGVLKIYFRQKQIVRKKQRKILDFTQENTRRFGNHRATTNATTRQNQTNVNSGNNNNNNNN